MFSKKTVFIVGAGGSKELGLPVGDELKDAIAAKLNFAFQDGISLISGDRRIYQAIQRDLARRQTRNGNPYWSAGRAIAAAMPQALSIDNFLHTHYDDEKIVLMGKIAIAASILNAERASTIYVDPGTTQLFNFGMSAKTWHNTFCKMLTEGAQKSDIETIFKNVSFITFNYDRCIEHYVASWIENYFRIPSAEAKKITNEMNVVHPYGQIGQLPWQDKGIVAIPYGSNSDYDDLLEIASNIRTFTEQVEDQSMIEKTRNIIADAHQIIYIGFSFGRMNMDLLKTETGHIFKQVYGTVLGMSDPNIKMINHGIRDCILSGGNSLVGIPALEKCTGFQLLEDYYRMLTSTP